ncbi:MAG: hypothetical protein ACETWT_15700 [Thermodesulfobacteriota bacterium]
MAQKEQKKVFHQRITLIDNHPHIYVTPSSEKGEPSSADAAPFRVDQRPTDRQKESRKGQESFFGHHIGKLLDPDKAASEEFLSIDKELESSLERVREKLQRIRVQSSYGVSQISLEEVKHRHFIEDRNRAQETLFEDIIRYHREFETGLTSEDLVSLHDLTQMEAAHEVACSQEESIHELVECNLLTFLRRKAAEQAWRKLEGYMATFHIPFPIPPTMLDPTKPVRNEQVRDQQKRKAQEDFLTMAAQDLAELILGNVPTWVYYYPRKDTYLWQSTVLQGVAAGLTANFLMRYLSVWEENSSEILNKIQKEFTDRINALRQQGQSAIKLPDILSVSNELQRISREQMPEEIWRYICSKLEVTT